MDKYCILVSFGKRWDFPPLNVQEKEYKSAMTISANPKYMPGDRVQFLNNGKVVTGTIYGIDHKTSFLCPDGFSYKVLSDYMLYQHVNENRLVEM